MLAACPLAVMAQNGVAYVGAEYKMTGSIAGDQINPRLAANSMRGILVWQDNATDEVGQGISAQLLDGTLAPTLGAFRVNALGADDQENPSVSLLSNGGAAFVWQGGKQGAQKIYARFLTSSNTFATSDIQVSSFDGNQIDPRMAALSDGSVVVTYASEAQDGSMMGVYAQQLTATGDKQGAEFRVNQYSLFNQRTPSISALSGGNYVVAWISEQQRQTNSVDVMARIFTPDGKAVGNEFRINTETNVCANPVLAGTSDGGFVVAWSQNNGFIRTESGISSNSWDVVARSYDAQGKPVTGSLIVNATTYGDQYAPQAIARGADVMVVWTSMGQDGSWEGVYGRVLNSAGTFVSDEVQVNKTTMSKQFQPTVATDGLNQFLVAWSSFTKVVEEDKTEISFDLFGQRFAVGSAVVPLAKPSTPMVAAISQSRLGVAWTAVEGMNVAQYLLFIDEAETPITVSSNYFVAKNFAPSSTHGFRVQYQLSDGRISPLSDAVTGKTWGEDDNGDGIPDDWQTNYWGVKTGNWPLANEDSDGDGASTLQEFLAGTNPNDPNSVLRIDMVPSEMGLRVSWNTQPGLVYQVQISSDFSQWSNYGAPRLAVGSTDSVLASVVGGKSYYRILRVR